MDAINNIIYGYYKEIVELNFLRQHIRVSESVFNEEQLRIIGVAKKKCPNLIYSFTIEYDRYCAKYKRNERPYIHAYLYEAMRDDDRGCGALANIVRDMKYNKIDEKINGKIKRKSVMTDLKYYV